MSRTASRTGRWAGILVRYTVAAISAAVLFYTGFALLFSTEEEKRLRSENALYEAYYDDLLAQDALLKDVVDGLQVRDNDMYRSLFETDAPSLHPMTATDVIAGSDSLSDSFLRSAAATKTGSLLLMARNVEATFDEIFQLLAARADSLPPLSLPLEGMTYLQTGASTGSKHNPLYHVDLAHEGIDLIAPQGTPVRCAADGVVHAVIRSRKGLGNVVEVDHGAGYLTRYALLDEISVTKGKPVRRGQPVGTVGISSSTFAPHLHYEVLHDGAVLDPVHHFFASVSPDAYAKMLYMSVSTLQSLD